MILFLPNKCQGCRICEAACGFHHSGHTEFNPSLKSIQVSRDNDTAKISVVIDATCDLCEGELTPLCVKYCAYGARSVSK